MRSYTLIHTKTITESPFTQNNRKNGPSPQDNSADKPRAKFGLLKETTKEVKVPVGI